MAKTDQADRIIHLRPEAEKAMGFAQARVIGNDIFIAGMLSLTDGFEPLHPGDMGAQVEEIYRSMVALLEEEGFTIGNLVEERIFVTDMAAFVAANPIRMRYLDGALPATTAVQVSALVLPGLMVEVACLGRR